jgi:orotate phosphoribosyltransferase
VVVVEDLISTGKSSLNAVLALKEADLNIKGMVAIFTYGFDVAAENFKKEKVNLYTLSNYENLLEQALATNYISEKELKTLSEWNANPSEWNVK